jgi:CO/xanthine dehydrogenase Mo-binding subunit
VKLPAGALHAAYAGTAIARAKVISVDTAAALACPGVVNVLTATDIKALFSIPEVYLLMLEDAIKIRAWCMLLGV